MKNKTKNRNEIQKNVHKWPINYKNKKRHTALDRLKIGHVELTLEYLIAKKEPSSNLNDGTLLTIKHTLTECHQYEIPKKKKP